MRISDWSSDVCSSDLLPGRIGRAPVEFIIDPCPRILDQHRHRHPSLSWFAYDLALGVLAGRARRGARQHRVGAAPATRQVAGRRVADRSEEHTSELQSLMRISYAVFCLKKKKNASKART